MIKETSAKIDAASLRCKFGVKMLVDRKLSRPVHLFQHIDQANGIGLEIGALDDPCALRSVGKVYYADYCSTADLRRLHRGNPTVNPDNFVEVDFVTGGGPLAPIVPADLKFDYVVASHVIEHVPDIICWLRDIGSILKSSGILSLIVPNKEVTFDLRRSPSEQKDFFAAFIQKQQKPSPIQVFDFFRWHDRDGRLVHTIEDAIEKAAQALVEYVDCHCWVFTPKSFHDEIGALCEGGFIPFRLDEVTRTPPGEIDMFARLLRL